MKVEKRLFSYWMSGGITGQAMSSSPHALALKLFEATPDMVWFVSGSNLNQPWIYTSGRADLKIWEVKNKISEEEIHNQAMEAAFGWHGQG